MRIAEIFRSIQGEGRHAGTESVFVRTTGCNLRCWFCDTDYTSWQPEGFQRDWRDVLAEVSASACEHVVVTGGEPLLQPDVVPLTRALGAAGHVVTVETAGTVYRPVHADLMSLSPKLSNSTPWSDSRPEAAAWAERHERRRCEAAVLERLLDEFAYQLKFVIDRPDDLPEVVEWLARFPRVSPEAVFLMPQARAAEELREKSIWLEEAASRHGWRVSPRLHIELFGNVRGR